MFPRLFLSFSQCQVKNRFAQRQQTNLDFANRPSVLKHGSLGACSSRCYDNSDGSVRLKFLKPEGFEDQGGGISISNGNGIIIKTKSFSIALDPKRPASCDYTFVSHAHIDHVHVPNGKSKIIVSGETKELAKARGYDLGETSKEAPGIEPVDSGHIFGSRGVLVKDKVFYTGDLSVRDRAFLKGCRGVKCDTLIMETTYGRPHYLFAETEKVQSQVNCFIAQCFDRCRPVVLTGYPLGKAQLISSLFSDWEPVYLHDSIHKMNSSHIHLGVKLKEFDRFDEGNAEFERKLTMGPWVLIAPTFGGRSPFIKTLREKYNAAIATFSGWAVDSRYKYVTNVENAFPISDHCDFRELENLVKYCNPSTVYTVHGFASEFASHLRDLGFDAEPLNGDGDLQSRLTSFAK